MVPPLEGIGVRRRDFFTLVGCMAADLRSKPRR
jgi:hypothetical protein